MDYSTIISNIGVWVLIVGTLSANVPQYVRLYRRKNTQGINEAMLIMGTLGCLTSLCGDILDNRSYLIANCSDDLNTQYECYMRVVGLVQLACPYIIAYVFYIMYFYYTRINDFADPNSFLSVKTRFIQVLAINLALCVFTVISFFVLSDTTNHQINIGLNVVSTVFSIFMWLPQIKETYQQKGNYSLSAISILIHSWGCMSTTIFQTVFNGQSFFVVLPYAMAGLLELTLFCMCMYYKYKPVTKKELYEPLNTN